MKILLAILLLVSSVVYASGVYLDKTKARNGATLVRLVNHTPYQVYCFVTYDNGYGFFDFYIAPSSASQWYYEPVGYYEWSCK